MGDCGEKRVQDRVRVRIRLALIGKFGPVVYGWTQNISLSGAYVETEGRFPVDSICSASGLANLQGALLKLRAEARIVRHDETGMGIQFTTLDLEAEHAIRRLVEHNRQ
jgi:hypothetical protein